MAMQSTVVSLSAEDEKDFSFDPTTDDVAPFVGLELDAPVGCSVTAFDPSLGEGTLSLSGPATGDITIWIVRKRG